MRAFRLAVLVAMIMFIGSSMAVAGDFDWMKDFSTQASLDPSGFRARLATRFQIGDAKISVVLGNLPDPADAYMALKMAEMSHQPPEKVIDVYKANKGKGWGVMDKNMGIKPGSAEFKALKNGHDLDGNGKEKKGGKDKKGKGKK
jgi:hypothetical protein